MTAPDRFLDLIGLFHHDCGAPIFSALGPASRPSSLLAHFPFFQFNYWATANLALPAPVRGDVSVRCYDRGRSLGQRHYVPTPEHPDQPDTVISCQWRTWMQAEQVRRCPADVVSFRAPARQEHVRVRLGLVPAELVDQGGASGVQGRVGRCIDVRERRPVVAPVVGMACPPRPLVRSFPVKQVS